MSVKTLAAALLTSLVALSTQAYAQAPQLAGRSLMWAEVISEDCELPPELEISDKGELSGNTACNSITGKMTQEGDKVDFSQMDMTKRACGPALMNVENSFVSNLKAAKTVKADGESVVFFDAESKKLMTLVPMKPGSCL